MADSLRRRTQGQAKAEAKADNSAGPDSATTLATAAEFEAPTTSVLPPVSSSSFFSVPSVGLTGVGIFPPWSGIAGRYIYDALGQRMSHQACEGGAVAKALVPVFTFINDDGLLVSAWAVLQSSVFRRGSSTSSAVPYFAAAVVLNHARRTVCFGCAAAGFFVRPQPADDWRLLLARPDVLLGDVVRAVGGPGFALISLLQKSLWDVLAGVLPAVYLLVTDETSTPRLFPQSRLGRTIRCRSRDVATTLFLVWLAACVEYAVAQASGTLAIAVAVWKMLQMKQQMGWSFGQLMVVYPFTGLLPLLVRSVQRPVAQPGVLLCLLSTVVVMDTLLRYRSRLYIAIETSGLFIFLGYGVLSALLIAADRQVKWWGRQKRQ
ncbi:MAG: hypothetical protein STHCBS139747_005492 [Sporothrix thermara]